MVRGVAIVFVMGLFLQLCGCASKPVVSADPLGDVPGDFTIDVAVIAGGGAQRTDDGGIVPAELRSGRFIVLPGGDLYFAPRDVRERDMRPPLTRRLTPDELSQLWSMCSQAGFMDATPLTMSEARRMAPDSGEVSYIITIQVEGVYRGVAETYERSRAADTAEAALVRELATLAWADELQADRVMVIPKRYDFGPDPYEQYRNP